MASFRWHCVGHCQGAPCTIRSQDSNAASECSRFWIASEYQHLAWKHLGVYPVRSAGLELVCRNAPCRHQLERTDCDHPETEDSHWRQLHKAMCLPAADDL